MEEALEARASVHVSTTTALECAHADALAELDARVEAVEREAQRKESEMALELEEAARRLRAETQKTEAMTNG